MAWHEVALEAHGSVAVIYVAGFLGERSVLRAGEFLDGVRHATRTVRVDLRGVSGIDPDAFAQLAAKLATWRNSGRGRVIIQFPEPSRHRPIARPCDAPHKIAARALQ